MIVYVVVVEYGGNPDVFGVYDTHLEARTAQSVWLEEYGTDEDATVRIIKCRLNAPAGTSSMVTE